MLLFVADAGLVERGDELALLDRLIEQASDGTGVVAVVRGSRRRVHLTSFIR
jgi:hypothetical protein